MLYTILYMYLAIDVGGTKTLMAVFSEAGEILAQHKIATDHSYPNFLDSIKQIAVNELKNYQITHCCCAAPGTIDFEKGVALAFGNEDWRNVPIREDIQSLFPNSKVLIHNDAKLAALSEAILLANQYNKVLYLTMSTGIGGGVVNQGKIDPDFENFEPGQMVFEKDGKNLVWEDFASGRALKEQYGKLASEITDPDIWRTYAHSLANGFENLIATVKPDVIIVGGGVGSHLDKFKDDLDEELKKFNNPLVPIPPILKAKRPEEAVIYGCYELIKQHK
jgi:predicted NBD/HSP70 family sugar kinase